MSDRLRAKTPRFLFRRGFVMVLALVAYGCMIGPDYHQPPARIATNWEEAGNAAVDSSRVQYQDWWSVFNDPTLTRLIQLAYQQNLTLLSAGVRVLEARAQLGIAIA